MGWKHPEALWLLVALAGIAALYVRAHRRAPARGVIRYPLWLAEEAARHAGPVRRHLAAGVFLLALCFMIAGAAAPVVPWWSPTGWPVALVIDVSRSMEEPDIPPSRIAAAKAAAIDFVNRLPRTTKAAVVSFGNYATVVVPLTNDHARLREGIGNLSTQLRTQLGTGLVEGVRAITDEGSAASPFDPSADQPRAVAILLTDGRASDGVPPLEAAAEARRRGVRVYTVGVGTINSPSAFRSGYWGVLDESTLRAIASETGGLYFHADEAARLQEIYRDLARIVAWERRPTEAAAIAGAAALMLLVLSVAIRSWLAPVT